MNKDLFRKVLPHIIAILVFLIVAVIYCKPALEGQVLQQSDISAWKGSIHQSQLYAEKHDGKLPLWTNSLFSGMPAFQIGTESNNYLPGFVHTIMTLGLPAPIQFFFLACICFYILCIILRVNPYIGIMGALGFAYATYNPVIISVGHATKMWSIAYMPAVLGSLILIYERRYWLGAALTALFAATMIAMNHVQIVYYFFLAAAIMTIAYIIRWAKAKEWKHLVMALVFAGVAVLVGVLVNAVTLLSTYEYQKETIRGGNSVLTDTTVKKQGSQTGLDRSYVFEYSFGIAEPLVMMLPRMYGGSSDSRDLDQDKSKVIESLQSIGQQNIDQIRQQTGIYLPDMIRTYWGGLGGVGTSGPPYMGAIICFLAIIAMFVLDGKHKWWCLAAIALSVILSWGSYFPAFNYFMFDHFPLYNKFRAPSMIMVIPGLLLPMLAVLGVNAFVATPDKKALLPAFKKGLIATGVLFVIFFLIYFSSSFMTHDDTALLNQVRDSNQPQLYDVFRKFYDGLKADRQGLMMTDIWRALLFVAIAALTLFLVIRKTINGLLATAILAIFVFVDLITVDLKYLNKENYQDEIANEGTFIKNAMDDSILADTSFFRVLNLSGGAYMENYTSYYFNSLGGYHPAKLRIYQDLIDRRITKEQRDIIQVLQTNPDSIINVNTPTANMLNAKYFIYKQGEETKGKWLNPHALGNAWFVDSIRFVKDANAEMDALNSINPETTAVIQELYRPQVTAMPQPDSNAAIHLVKNDNDIIHYTSSSATNQFAVFSEIYYKAGWKAFIDGKEIPIVKVNYVLRGLSIPAGRHAIEFRFEPRGHIVGKKLTTVFTIALLLLLAAGLFFEWKSRKKTAGAMAS